MKFDMGASKTRRNIPSLVKIGQQQTATSHEDLRPYRSCREKGGTFCVSLTFSRQLNGSEPCSLVYLSENTRLVVWVFPAEP